MTTKEIFKDAIAEEIASLMDIADLVEERKEEEVKELVKRIIRHELKESKKEIISILRKEGVYINDAR